MLSAQFDNSTTAFPVRTTVRTRRLSREQVDRFHADGFLSIPSITTPDEVAWIRQIYDRLFAERAGWSKGDFFDFAGADEEGKAPRLPQLLNPSQYEPALARTLFRTNAEAMARQLLGPRAKLIFEHAMMKPGKTGGETAWHQDHAFYARYTNYRAVTIWMPLQAVDERNGCLEFIPESHNGAITPHRHLDDDPRVHGLEAIGVDASKAVVCPLPAGGATFHSDRTLHHAGPNRSSEPRRAYALVFGVRGRQFTLREEYPWNRASVTAREQRLVHSRGPVQHVVAALKELSKAVLRR